jgi:hypothetical protein
MTGNTMTGNTSWRELYESAMLELDPVCLQRKMDIAQVVIRQAMKDLTGSRQAGAAEELEALSAALGNLQTLQRVESRRTISTSSQNLSPAEGGSRETHVPKNSNDNLAQTPVGHDGAAS